MSPIAIAFPPPLVGGGKRVTHRVMRLGEGESRTPAIHARGDSPLPRALRARSLPQGEGGIVAVAAP
jgi:hypothetical protein